MSKRILLVWLLCLAPLAAWSKSAPVILVMGDSLSAAYGIDSDQGWVNLLQQRLATQHYDYTVVNASVSGETSAGGLTRFATAMEHHPAVVILELGANDGLRGLPVPEMRANLGRMIAMAKAEHAKVLLVGMLLPPNYGGPYTQAFAAAYPALARQYHLPLVPFLLDKVAQHRELMQDDGLHPKAGGESQVLENVWSRLQPLLKK